MARSTSPISNSSSLLLRTAAGAFGLAAPIDLPAFAAPTTASFFDGLRGLRDTLSVIAMTSIFERSCPISRAC
jgi:hypothetical protein